MSELLAELVAFLVVAALDLLCLWAIFYRVRLV